MDQLTLESFRKNTCLSYREPTICGGGSLGLCGERKRAILGAEINHRFCGMRIVHLFRTLEDNGNSQFLSADLRK